LWIIALCKTAEYIEQNPINAGEPEPLGAKVLAKLEQREPMSWQPNS
jgi:hypothetical protein